MTLSDVGEGGVKNPEKCSDVICGCSLKGLKLSNFEGCDYLLKVADIVLNSAPKLENSVTK